jgi:hypothetical protein
MNTKLTFYCTHFQYGSFEKIIFETVTEDTFKSDYAARLWVDEQVPSYCDEFDLSLVFDWVVINYHETKDDVSDVKIIKTIGGDLVFAEPKKARKPRTVKPKTTVTVTVEPKVEEKVKKEYRSCWIDTSGKTNWVGFANHNDFACHWLKENDKVTYKKVKNSLGRYYTDALEEKGWIRILGWTDPPSFVLPDNMSPKQKISLREYCINQGVAYTAWPEILKS